MSDSVLIYDHDGLEKGFEKLIQAVNLVKNIANNEVDKLKAQLDIPPVQQFTPLFLGAISLSLETISYSDDRYVYLYIGDQECRKWLCERGLITFVNQHPKFKLTEKDINRLYAIIDALAEHDKPIHEENIQKRETNKRIQFALESLFKRIGIPLRYYGPVSKRSKREDWITYGWFKELMQLIPVNYQDNRLEQLIKKHKELIDKWYKEELQRIEEKKVAMEKEKQEKERTRQLVLLLTKYGLDLQCDWEDLLQEIIRKNKYLRLAYYLEENRNDWTCGYEYAEEGLSTFEVENDFDQKIYDEVSNLIETTSEFPDGRFFRDTYNALYSLVEEQDKELYEDYWAVRSMIY